MIAEVTIRFKPGVLDAEGKTVQKNLESMGYPIKKVTSLKTYELEVDAKTPQQAKEIAEDACQKMLANPVIQSYEINIR